MRSAQTPSGSWTICEPQEVQLPHGYGRVPRVHTDSNRTPHGPGEGSCDPELAGVSGITESWGLKLLCYLLCLQGSDTEEKESRSSVTSSPNDKQIDLTLWLWQSKQG